MAAKGFAQENLQQRNFVIMISLDVKGACKASWWPNIQCNLRGLRCPRNFYNLAQSYYSDRVTIFQGNTFKVERKVSMGCQQGSYFGPVFWIILYNVVLNLEFSSYTKVIAFADHLVVLTQRKTPIAAELCKFGPC